MFGEDAPIFPSLSFNTPRILRHYALPSCLLNANSAPQVYSDTRLVVKRSLAGGVGDLTPTLSVAV
jgi:hypothetical protein